MSPRAKGDSLTDEELARAAAQAKLAEESPEGLQPWDRQPGERAKPWIAFQLYRDLGPDRSFSEVARRVYVGANATAATAPRAGRGRYQAKGVGRVRQWAIEYNWVARVTAYDLHVDRQRQRAAVDQVKAMLERHLGISGMMQQKAVTALRELDPERLKKYPKELLALLVEGVKMERLARGESTERVAAEVTGAGSAEVSQTTKDLLRQRLEGIAQRKRLARETAAQQQAKAEGESAPPPVVIERPTEGVTVLRHAVRHALEQIDELRHLPPEDATAPLDDWADGASGTDGTDGDRDPHRDPHRDPR